MLTSFVFYGSRRKLFFSRILEHSDPSSSHFRSQRSHAHKIRVRNESVRISQWLFVDTSEIGLNISLILYRQVHILMAYCWAWNFPGLSDSLCIEPCQRFGPTADGRNLWIWDRDLDVPKSILALEFMYGSESSDCLESYWNPEQWRPDWYQLRLP